MSEKEEEREKQKKKDKIKTGLHLYSMLSSRTEGIWERSPAQPYLALQRTFALAYLTYFSTKDGGPICTCGEAVSCNDEMPENFTNFY